MKLKGYNKLMLQVVGLAAILIGVSFFTETQFWLDHFCHKVDSCNAAFCPSHENQNPHHHWGYRAWIYLLMGIVLTIISIFRISNSHKEEDFK